MNNPMTDPYELVCLKTNQALYLDYSRVGAKTISGHCRFCLQVWWPLEELNPGFIKKIYVPYKCIVLFILQPSKYNLGTHSQELSPWKVSADEEGDILDVEAWITVRDHSRVRPVRELPEVALFIHPQGSHQVLEMEESLLHLKNQENE